MRLLTRLPRLAVMAGAAGAVALLGMVLGTVQVSACTIGTPDCPYPPLPPPAAGQNGLQTILAIDIGEVVVLGALLLLLVLYLAKRRSRTGRADK